MCRLTFYIRYFYLRTTRYIYIRQGGTSKRINCETPDKGGRDCCTLPGVFCCSGKGQAIPVEGSGRGFQRAAPAGSGEARTECCPHERGYHEYGTSREHVPATRDRTIYIFCTYRSSFQGDCGLFLFDIFLSASQYEYKKIQYLLYGRACHCAGAFFHCRKK